MNGGLYDPDTIALETSLGYYLTKARQALVERMDRALEPFDLTAQQIGVILLLSRGYARTPFELSRKMSYDSGSMTRMLDRLERKGLVARSRSEQDRRMIELTLTERGADAARALPSLIATALNAQLAGFSADELAMLTGLRIRRILLPVTLLFLALCGVQLFVFRLNPAVLSVHPMMLPWGEVISNPATARPGWWFGPLYGFGLLIEVFGLYCGFKVWRRDRLAGGLIIASITLKIGTHVLLVLKGLGLIQIPFFGMVDQVLWVAVIAVVLNLVLPKDI